MTADAFAFVEWFCTYIWALFTTWYVPGTAMTPAQFLMFGLFIAIVMPFVKRFFSKL